MSTFCPYPGLRPFQEEEAIFFRGRDAHIEEVTRQLEEKKFLMLTGASGDGKSSLVYAGVIPNARAGFFKAKFNNWIVADFRPERTPLANMAGALAKHLGVDPATAKKELGYGFSALSDLYRSSSYWVDQASAAYNALSPENQKAEKRKGANLLLLVDQFEEFFTNPENYMNGTASLEAQAVVNVLLETARIAAEEDLPIYIICTMRSDYVGECAAFRGLPEYIGYSQFFVPRLKRNEIYQVIEEPALMNGNRISKRLVEMLINEMNDGIDQLPVLQHALNQIWQKADNGRKEMDVIHFALVNGIPREQLNDSDRDEFDRWFEKQPAFKKACFVNPSLAAVLDAHANELYETSGTGVQGINAQEAKLIVMTTFKCLTRIDDSRAVRNRITLQEVTAIINKPKITPKVVALVLKPFRKQGTTFVKPFLNEGVKNDLAGDTVLDITHESLIRNWGRLGDWAREENEHLATWLDFHKQLTRWVRNRKSSGYLLPIGPLTFFEEWISRAGINRSWIARYDESENLTPEEKLANADQLLADIGEFIRRSGRRLIINRTVIRFGADKIIAAFGLLLFLFGCIYFYFNFRTKQDGYVLEDIMENCEAMLNSKQVPVTSKASYIIAADRIRPRYYESLLEKISDDSVRIRIMQSVFENAVYLQEGKRKDESDNPLPGKSLITQLSFLETRKAYQTNTNFLRHLDNVIAAVISEANLERLGYRDIPLPDYKFFCDNYQQRTLAILDDTTTLKEVNIKQVNLLLQAYPYVVRDDSLEITKLINKLSPYEAGSARTFDILYPVDKQVRQNAAALLSHNGGYYQLACLFAASGRFGELTRCMDSLVKYNPRFTMGTEEGYNYGNILANMLRTGTYLSDEGRKFMSRITDPLLSENEFSTEAGFLLTTLCKPNHLSGGHVSRAGEGSAEAYMLRFENERLNFVTINAVTRELIRRMNTVSAGQEQKQWILGAAGNRIPAAVEGQSGKNYMIALLHKALAFSRNTNKNNFSRSEIIYDIEKAIDYFDLVTSDYLNSKISVGTAAESDYVSRNVFFKQPFSPDFRTGRDKHAQIVQKYQDKALFLEVINNRKGYDRFFLSTDEDAHVLNSYLNIFYGSVRWNDSTENHLDVSPFLPGLKSGELHRKIEPEPLKAYVALQSRQSGNIAMADWFVDKIDFVKLMRPVQADPMTKAGRYGLSQSLFYFLVTHEEDKPGQSSGKADQSAFRLLNAYPDAYQIRNTLIAVSDSLLRSGHEPLAIKMLDHLLSTQVSRHMKSGTRLFEILGSFSAESTDRIAMTLMKDREPDEKNDCLLSFIEGKARQGSFYVAQQALPDYLSSGTEMEAYLRIMREEIRRSKTISHDGWSSMDSPVYQDLSEYEEHD